MGEYSDLKPGDDWGHGSDEDDLAGYGPSVPVAYPHGSFDEPDMGHEGGIGALARELHDGRREERFDRGERREERAWGQAWADPLVAAPRERFEERRGERRGFWARLFG